MNKTMIRASVALAGAALSLAGSAWGQATNRADLGDKPDTEIVAEQYLLIGDATRGGGESQVAVNPRNPNEIVVAAMSVMNSNQGEFKHNERRFKRTPRAVITEFAVTHDRGLTWSVTEDPMRDYFHRYRCLDPFADFAPDGTMIVGCEAQRPTSFTPDEQAEDLASHGTADPGGPTLMTSNNGGRTWNPPVQVLGNPISKAILGPFVSFDPALTYADAPKIHVDASTGKIYLSGMSPTSEPPKHEQLVIRASDDGGLTWGRVYAADAPEWVSSGRASYDVANGIVAVAYMADKTPDANVSCPCLVFGASEDDGKTFVRHVTPVKKGEGPGEYGLGGSVFADPSRRGHFLVLTQSGDQVHAYETLDSGARWSAPRLVAQAPGLAIANLTARFGASGDFAVVWRAVYHDPKAPAVRRPGYAANVDHIFADSRDTFEIWSTLSRDGGKTFSPPLKVSTARSPGTSRRRGMSMHGADFISVALDKDFVHMSWFDNRSGFLATWYGRVPIADYRLR